MNVIQKYGKGGGRFDRTSLQQLKFYVNASLCVVSFCVCLVVRFLLLLH